jgi:hypothetical protein
MGSLTEKLHASGFVISEGEGNISRDNGVLITGQNLGAGAVLGKITLGAAVAAVKASGANTGNGTLVMDGVTPILANAKVGIYTVRCVEAVGNGGKFVVTDPNGQQVGVAIIVAGAGGAIVFADQIKFTLTDGGADFIVGDGFDVTIAAGSGKFTAVAPAALDGSQVAAGVLVDAVDATGADVACAVIARSAEVNSAELVWPGGITAPQKAAALAQLAAAQVIAR